MDTLYNHEAKRTDDILSFRRETESFIYRQLDKFGNIQSKEQLFTVIKASLEGLGQYFKADRVFIYQDLHEDHVQHVKFGWRNWSRIDRNLNEENCALQIISYCREELERDGNVTICDLETIRDGYPSLYRPLCVCGVKSWVAVPVFKNGELDGLLSIVNPEMQHLDTLTFLLRSMSTLFVLHSQSVSNMEKVLRLSSIDHLTGLDNRSSGGKKVDESLSRGECGAYMLLDFDNFKLVNEKFGHEVGDRLLTEASKVIKRVFPQGFAMRMGGNEFGVFFPLLEGDREMLGHWMNRLFYNINRMKVDGLGGHRVSFSLGAFSYESGAYKSFDQIYQHARILCHEAKDYEGNYVMTDKGGIPDLETAFYLLREDRHLYDSLNDDLFNINDEESWLHYLDNSAMLKSNMCWRNQRQYEQILSYFTCGHAIEDDYSLLYDLVLRFRNTLDAFMVEKLVGDILLPHYEELYRSNSHILPENVICGRLAKLYLHLGDSLIGIHLMGDTSNSDNICQLFKNCIEVSKKLVKDDPAYEYQIYALSQLIGHYELFDLPQISPEQRDVYYLQLKKALIGPESITLRDPILLPYYTYLLQNARSYPILRASQLTMHPELTVEEHHELLRKLIYIRQHSPNGVLESCQHSEFAYRLDRLLQKHLFKQLPARELFYLDYQELTIFRDKPSAIFSTSDMMGFLILMLAAVSTLKSGGFTDEERRRYALEGWDLFIQLYKRKKNEATDRQSWYMACFLLSLFIRNHMLTAQDKREYLIRTMGVLMIDTYSHSKAMVAYAKVIMTHIIDQHPQLLCGVLPKMHTKQSVQQHRKELLDFIETACLLHDIGKLAQIPIITNSYRKLTDHEFQILRKHPTTGRSMLCEEHYFDQFEDVIEGHHCSYDGKSGYPAGYQFKHPEQHILVDIVSICDSLEAATSHIGRNYRVAKSFCQIMDEFYAQSGTRYNPDVLEAIISSPQTYNELKEMVDQNWRTVYRDIFQEIVQEHNNERTPEYKKWSKSSSANLTDHRAQPNSEQTMSIDQLRRLAKQQEIHNQWLTQKLIDTVESRHELDQVTKGLHSIYQVMALVKVKDGSIKILQGSPDFLRDFPPTQYHPARAMTEYSIKYIVKPKWVDQLLEFNDISTLADRLHGRNSINVELETNLGGWYRYSCCPAEYDEQGNLDKVLFMSECINDEVLALQKIKFLAEYDGLTGLHSRYGGEQQIREMLDKQTPGIFLIMDVDAFKSINDNYGHAVGDHVLEALGKVLQRRGEEYTIIRQGGDEFVSFCKTESSVKEYVKKLDDFFNEIEGIRIPELYGMKISVSVGAVRYDGTMPATFDELFRAADKLLYVSKRTKGCCYSIVEYCDDVVS